MSRAERVFRSRPIRSAINAATLAALLFAVATAMAESASVEVDLSAMAIDGSMDEFMFARTGQGELGKWEIITEPGAKLGLAIAQTSQDRTDYRFPLAIYRPLSIENAKVSVRFKPVAGRVDQAGGIAVRLADADNYYLVRANALEDNVRFYRVVNGSRRQIDGANLKMSSGAWHTLTLVAHGDRFTVGFDGKELFTAKDDTFASPGRIALWTKADSVTYFDQLRIDPIP
jgi:hypothetical protein